MEPETQLHTDFFTFNRLIKKFKKLYWMLVKISFWKPPLQFLSVPGIIAQSGTILQGKFLKDLTKHTYTNYFQGSKSNLFAAGIGLHNSFYQEVYWYQESLSSSLCKQVYISEQQQLGHSLRNSQAVGGTLPSKQASLDHPFYFKARVQQLPATPQSGYYCLFQPSPPAVSERQSLLLHQP